MEREEIYKCDFDRRAFLKTFDKYVSELAQFSDCLDYKSYEKYLEFVEGSKVRQLKTQINNLQDKIELITRNKPNCNELIERIENVGEALTREKNYPRDNFEPFCYYIGMKSPDGKKQGEAVLNIRNNLYFSGETRARAKHDGYLCSSTNLMKRNSPVRCNIYRDNQSPYEIKYC